MLQIEERAAEGVRHSTRHARHAMWGAGMRKEGQERTGCEAKLSSAHLRARHTPPGLSEMAGLLGCSFPFLLVVAQSLSASGELLQLNFQTRRLAMRSAVTALRTASRCCRDSIAWEGASLGP